MKISRIEIKPVESVIGPRWQVFILAEAETKEPGIETYACKKWGKDLVTISEALNYIHEIANSLKEA